MALDPDTSIHSTASASSGDLDSIFTTQADDVSTTPTSRHPSGQQHVPQPGPAQAQPQPRSQATLNAISNFRGILRDVTVEAQRQLRDQPRATQLALTTQTRSIHKQYESHGTQSRLSWNLWEFLTAREDLKEGSGEGELVFWNHEEAQMAKPEHEREDNEMLGAGTAENRGEGNIMWVKAEDMFDESVWNGNKPAASVESHRNRRFRINGEVGNGNTTDASDMLASHAAAMRFGSQTETYNPRALFTPSEDSSIRLNDNIFIDPRTVKSTVPSSGNSSSQTTTSPVLYTNDPSSTEILKSLPFRPADIVFTFPSYTNFPGGGGTYITHMNNIATLHNTLANAMLRHHEMKYLSEELNTPDDIARLDHGYVVLRAGIGELVRDQVKEMFGSARENDWGLTTETRSFLKEIYDSKELGTAVRSGQTDISGLPTMTGYSEGGLAHQRVPVLDEDDNIVDYDRGEVVAGRGKLSVIEQAMVARATRVPVDGVGGWWEERKMERLPLTAMRVWVGAREVERGRKARAEGRFYGWEGWTEEAWEEIGGGNDDE